MNRWLLASVSWCASVLLVSCGPEDAPTQVNASSVSDIATAPADISPHRESKGLDILRKWISHGAEAGFRSLELDIRSANEPLLPSDAAIIRYDDPRIRHLGGRHSQPLTWPRNLMWWPQALSLVVEPKYETNGYSFDRSSLFDGYQFILPAGQDQFEALSLDDGHIGGLYVEVDGHRTSLAPLSFGHENQGRRRWTLVTLPPSDDDRDVRVVTRRGSLGEIRVPAGGTLGPRKPEWDERPRVVFVGDSITEGQGAGHGADSWAMQLAYRLGIDDPVNVALGGTGYLRQAGTRPNFRQHTADVLDAFGSRKPDVVFVAGGINDCGTFTPAEIGAEAATFFHALRAGAPDMAIVVFGPFSGPRGYEASLQACADAVFAAVAEVDNAYAIDVSDWVTDQTTGFIFNGDGVDPHPVRLGHDYYAKRGEMAVRELLRRTLPPE